MTWSTPLPPRGSGGGPAWLTASQMEDREEVLQDKVPWRYMHHIYCLLKPNLFAI